MKTKLLSVLLAFGISVAQGDEIFYKEAPHYNQAEGAIVMCCALVPLPEKEKKDLLHVIDLFKAKKIEEANTINNLLIEKIQTLLSKDNRLARASISSESMVLKNLIAASNNAQKSTYLVSRDWGLPFYLRAFAFFENKNPEQAKKSLDTALVFSPYDPQTLNERGHYYSMMANWDAAEKDYILALEMSKLILGADSEFFQGRALRGLGFIAVERNLWQQAADYYAEALKINPNDTKAKGELQYVKVNRL